MNHQQLLIVVHGPLLWPPELGGTLRGDVGTVVPADDPALAGQEWRCHGLPVGDTRGVTAHDNPLAARWYATRGYGAIPFVDREAAARDAATRAERERVEADTATIVGEVASAPRRHALDAEGDEES